MLFENIINHIIVLFFFCASYAIGRFVFNNFLSAIAFGVSIVSFIIYNIFLVFGINPSTVSSIFAIMLVSIILFATINRTKIFDFTIKNKLSFLSKKLFHPEFFLLSFLLLIYFIKCSFPLADGDSLNNYSYLPKLYISGESFSAGNFLQHGRLSLLYPSLVTFLAYFGTLDIASIFNFYLTILLIGTLYGMCLSAHIHDRINSNSFCLVACIFVANPLMNFIISTGRPYVLIAYLCTVLLHFLLLNFNQKPNSLYILFLGIVGGSLASVNHLGIAILGCLLIALVLSNYNALNRFVKLIFVSGLFVIGYSLPFYLRTYILGDLLYPLASSFKLNINEFTGYFGAIKALFILSTRNNQAGSSCSIGILYLSFLPVLLYFIFKQLLWNIKRLLFLFFFIISYYFIWLSKIPQARSLMSIFPPYLFLLYLIVDLRKPVYKYAIYLFSGLMIIYCISHASRFDYSGYLLNKRTKTDFVYNVLNKSHAGHNIFEEQNEIVTYIISNFRNYDVVFCDGVFPLTLLPNKVFNVSFKKQGQIKEHNTVFICQNSVQQMLTPLKCFKNYTLYAYK